MDDPYGVNREVLIKKSGVRNIFTPNMPIHAVDLFSGRKELVKSVIEGLNTPGQHLLLYGDRGVGKSSLANVTVDILKNSGLIDGELIIKRCSSDDTFESLAIELINKYSDKAFLTDETVSTKKSENTSAKIIGIGAGLSNDKTSTKKYSYSYDITPSYVANLLKDKKGLFLIDEFDTLEDDTDKKKLAQLIKLLSDFNAPFKIFVVGIAESGTELTAGHPSVNRCLKEIKLDRMTDDEIKAIVNTGMKKLSLEVSEQVIKIILTISNGYPHFAHLIALKCAEEAIVNEKRKVTKSEFIVAVDNAVKDAEGTLQRLYDNAIQNASERKKNNIQMILLACTDNEYVDFSLNAITDKLKIYGNELKSKTISNYIGEFTTDNGESILRRIKKGVYRFNDPRMLSYIRMRNNLIERDRQKLEYGKIH